MYMPQILMGMVCLLQPLCKLTLVLIFYSLSNAKCLTICAAVFCALLVRLLNRLTEVITIEMQDS
jgi:hypothetical protein